MRTVKFYIWTCAFVPLDLNKKLQIGNSSDATFIDYISYLPIAMEFSCMFNVSETGIDDLSN